MMSITDVACIVENPTQYRKLKKLLKDSNVVYASLPNPTFPLFVGISEPKKGSLASTIYYELKNEKNGVIDVGYCPVTINIFETILNSRKESGLN